MPYFKIDTRIKDWEWHDSPNIMALWVAILYLTNWKEKKWHGITIERGQFITSTKHLSQMTGLSQMQVRTCLDKLKLTGEVTIKATNKYTIITVNKWEEYQVYEKQDNKQDSKQQNNQITLKQQTNNKQITTTEALKHLSNVTNNKDSKDIVSLDAHAVIDHFNQRLGTNYRYSKTAMTPIMARLGDGYTVDQCNGVIDKKCVDWAEDAKMAKYLTIETLFRPGNFEKYLNQVQAAPKEDYFMRVAREGTNAGSGNSKDSGNQASGIFNPF